MEVSLNLNFQTEPITKKQVQSNQPEDISTGEESGFNIGSEGRQLTNLELIEKAE